MSGQKTRREFVKVMAASSVAPLVVKMAQTTTSPSAGKPIKQQVLSRSRLEPFNYEGVRLSEGMLQRQFHSTRDFYFAIPDDDILKGFRQRAGLEAPGHDLGGWYSGDPTVIYWWSKGDTFNTFGQWLSGMARMAKATGDEALQEKAVSLMIEWGKAIEDDGFFFYSRRPNAPHYIYDKTVCGLVDLYEYCGRKDALVFLDRITDWAITNLDRVRRPNQGAEWYTLSENLYRAYVLTENSKYKDFADVWRYTDYWGFFTGQSNVAPYHYHAYSHVNTLSGAAMAYAVTGEDQYLKTIVNAYDWLERTQFYATGGYGPDEEWLPPDGSLAKSLETTYSTFETICGSWAGFKLARYLIQFTGESRYGDWIEKLTYNGIGAALPMTGRGETFYYSDYRLGGGRKYFHSETWPCCSGTYPQVVADYHNVIYFKKDNSLYVNLYVPSQLSWNCGGTPIEIEQHTSYPESESTLLTLRPAEPVTFKLNFRVPGWSTGALVKVNGTIFSTQATPGAWATIERTWNPGDQVSLQIPMKLRTIPIDKQHPRRVAFAYGPVVLVQTTEPTLPIEPAEAAMQFVPDQKEALSFTVAQPKASFVPFYRVGKGTPYNMYFDLQG